MINLLHVSAIIHVTLQIRNYYYNYIKNIFIIIDNNNGNITSGNDSGLVSLHKSAEVQLFFIDLFVLS